MNDAEISQQVTNFMLRGLSDTFLFSITPNQTPMSCEVLTVQKKNTLPDSCYHCMSQYERTIHLPFINSGVFLFSPEGFYCGRSAGVGFGLRQLLPSKRQFLCWDPTVNLIFLLSFDGETYGCWPSPWTGRKCADLDVEMLFLSSHRVIFILCTLAERCFPGRFTASQSLSTCRACSWQRFSGILEFLERCWRTFQTDRRQCRHLGDVAIFCLIVTCKSSLACVPTQSVWPSLYLKHHPAVPANRNISVKNASLLLASTYILHRYVWVWSLFGTF